MGAGGKIWTGIGIGVASVISVIVFLGILNPAGLSLPNTSFPTSLPSSITSFVDKDPDKDGLTTEEEYAFGSNPNLTDTDGDGLDDKQEKFRGTNPNDRDSDRDGLTDSQEVDKGTNPWQSDTDMDGLLDRQEVNRGTDPLTSDTDRDGLKDGEELDLGTNPLESDTDRDGLSDGREKTLRTNPLNRNTDGDRYDDGIDSQPTIKNSAFITMNAYSSDIDYNWTNIALLTLSGGTLANLNMEIAKMVVDVSAGNTGTDYTSYVTFDVIFKAGGEEIKRVVEKLPRVDPDQPIFKHYTYEITLGDLPSFILLILKEDNEPLITVTIQNLSYEKF